MSKNNTTAWALLVVSDPGQADTLPDQEAWAQAIAAERGWTITETFSGVSSGKAGARELTVRMLQQLEATDAEHRPARLLMIRLERLGRGDGTEAMVTFLRLRQLNVVIHTRMEGDVTYGRASELLMPMVRLLVGGMENEVRQDKLRAMYGRLRTEREEDPSIAISMNPPYGLAYVNGHLNPKPPEDAAVRLAYELKGQGYGSHLIGKRLTIVAPPLTLKNGEQRPQHWTPDRVARMIAKRTYRATLVDVETWERAQLPARVVTRPTMRQEYPLGGALRCVCGRALVGATGMPRRGVIVRFYQCRDLRNHGGRSRSHQAACVEKQFGAMLQQLTADDELLQNYAKTTTKNQQDADALGRRLTDLRGQISRIDERRRSVFEALEDDTLQPGELRWRLNDLVRTEEELCNQIRAVEREREFINPRYPR